MPCSAYCLYAASALFEQIPLVGRSIVLKHGIKNMRVFQTFALIMAHITCYVCHTCRIEIFIANKHSETDIHSDQLNILSVSQSVCTSLWLVLYLLASSIEHS